jgi:hypothetical protein
MSVSDLTNTKWEWNDDLIVNEEATFTYAVNGVFTWGGISSDIFYNFTSIRYTYGGEKIKRTGVSLYYNNGWHEVYLDGWYNVKGTIEFTGGTDATNSTLISWLEANATQVIEPTPTSNKITIGDLPINKMYFGNTEILKMYYGDIEIYSSGESPQPTTPNFILSNGNYLLTSENEYFNVMEEN